MSKSQKTWGEKLKALREKLKQKHPELTQEGAAKFLKVPLRTYQNWEQGHAEPPDYVKHLVTRALSDYR